mmetsp:Transcript_4291/g.7907  ORF Transcript_4291/g.7907 Transcript_4291/m.7907 type:complete len:267 (+) Transcript_4291:189-989(+)
MRRNTLFIKLAIFQRRTIVQRQLAHKVLWRQTLERISFGHVCRQSFLFFLFAHDLQLTLGACFGIFQFPYRLARLILETNIKRRKHIITKDIAFLQNALDITGACLVSYRRPKFHEGIQDWCECFFRRILIGRSTRHGKANIIILDYTKDLQDASHIYGDIFQYQIDNRIGSFQVDIGRLDEFHQCRHGGRRIKVISECRIHFFLGLLQCHLHFLGIVIPFLRIRNRMFSQNGLGIVKKFGKLAFHHQSMAHGVISIIHTGIVLVE